MSVVEFMKGLELNLKSKKTIAVILALFVILTAVFIVFRILFPIDETAAAIPTSYVQKKTVINLSGTKSGSKDNITAGAFVNKNELAFENDEYSAEVFSSVTVKLDIKSQSIPSASLEWSLSDKEAGEIKVENGTDATVTLKKAGKFELRASAPSGLYAACTVISKAPAKYQIDGVPFISQNNGYPSGCESISTTMLLNYFNYDISPETFIDGYLHTDYLRESDDGTAVVGPDPYTAFIGTPYDESSLGCYPPVVVDAMNKIFDETNSGNKAVDTTGMSLDELIDTYIVQDEPVLVWSTMYLWDAFVTDSWIVEGASEESPYKDGDLYEWIANEHCLVLTGYDKDYYYFNDPLYNNAKIQYEKTAFEQRFEEIGRCSAAINGGVNDKEITVNLPKEKKSE